MPAALSHAALGRGTQAEDKLRPTAREGLNPPGMRVLGLEVDPPVRLSRRMRQQPRLTPCGRLRDKPPSCIHS